MLKRKIAAVLAIAMTATQLLGTAVFAEELTVEDFADDFVAASDIIEAEGVEVQAVEADVTVSAPSTVSETNAPSTNKAKAEFAQKNGLGVYGDTLKLTETEKKANKKYLYTVNLSTISDNSSITIIKGGSFTVIDDATGKGAKKALAIEDRANKKLVSVSKKGLVKGKKATTDAKGVPVKVTVAEGKVVTMYVKVLDFAIDSVSLDTVNTVDTVSQQKAPSFKKLKVTAVAGQAFDVKINSTIGNFKILEPKDKKSATNGAKIALGEDGAYHIVVAKSVKGKATFPVIVNGKKYTITVNITKPKKIKAAK